MAHNEERRQTRRRVNAEEKGKGVCSDYGPQYFRGSSSNRAPWPRADAQPFPRTSYLIGMIPEVLKTNEEYAMRKKGDMWSDYHSAFYNHLLINQVIPTKFICAKSLRRLGIFEDVTRILGKIGLRTLLFNEYPLYPELVRQFLASCDIHAAEAEHSSLQDISLTYLSSGKLYEISILELCDLYGFDKTATDLSFNSDYSHLAEFWHLIGDGGYESKEARLMQIRNPAIRIAAKILGTLFYQKGEAGSITKNEMLLLHNAITEIVPGLYRDKTVAAQKVNLGYIFATVLTKRRFRGTIARPKIEGVGSLLTPIFMHNGVDLITATKVENIDRLNVQSFMTWKYMRLGLLWKYYGRDKEPYNCRLPNPAITSLTSRANVEFQPHISFPESAASNVGSQHRPSISIPPQSQKEDHTTHTDIPQHAPRAHDATAFEHIIPEYTKKYDVPAFSDDFTEREYRRWVYETEKRKNARDMHIWGALRKINIHQPSCFIGTSRRDTNDASRANAGATAATDEPIVAGHGIYDSGDGNDDEHLTTRLSKRKRAPKQRRFVRLDEI